MTLALEHVQDGDWAAVNRVVDALRSLVLDTGGRSLGMRFGVTTLTFPGASQRTNLPSITHGLGKTPAAVLVSVTNPAVDAYAWSGGITATTFQAQAQTATAAPVAGTTVQVAWLVIG